MSERTGVSRRTALGSGLALLVACRSTPKIAPEKPIDVPDAGGGPAPLAQDFTVAAHIPNDGSYYYMHDPGMTMLPSGKILVAAPCLGETTTGAQNVDHSVRVFIARSADRGQTWDTIATLPYSDATPFVSGDGRVSLKELDECFPVVEGPIVPREGRRGSVISGR